jgi:predicted permease
LLVVTSLFVRSLARASSVDPGFRTDRILLVDVDPRMSGAAPAVMERIRSGMEALPGVESATFMDVVPLGMGARAGNVRSAGDRSSSVHPIRADIFQVGPRFLKTLNIPLLRGRDFHVAGEASDPSVIINTTAAAQLWPGQDAVGRTLYRDGSAYRVIGLVPPTKTRTVGEAERPSVYLPMLGPARTDPLPFGVTLAILATGDPGRMSGAVRRAIHEIEPSLAVSNVRTIGQHIDSALIFPRAGALVFGCFGAIAILLTSAGLYGVMSHAVSRRTREFGIRFALGARKSDVIGGVLARGGMMAGMGVVIGFAVAFCGTRVFRTYLYGVGPTDPLTFAVVPLIVTGVCVLACYVPARHAAAVDPLVALKAD